MKMRDQNLDEKKKNDRRLSIPNSPLSKPPSKPLSPFFPPSMYRTRAAKASDAPQIAEFNRKMALETEELELDGPTLEGGVASVFEQPETTSALYFVAEEEEERAEAYPSSIVACAMVKESK
jgi:hypothetical protein